MRVERVTRGPLVPDDGPRARRLQRRAKGIAIEARRVRGADAAVAARARRCRGRGPRALWLVRRKPWMAVRLVAMAWWFLFGELRGIAGLAGIYVVTGGPLGRGSLARRRLVYDLRIHWARSHLGGRARAVRPDVRGRGPRAGRARAGDRPHPPREHHRQRAARRRDRARARARPAVRAQARAADDPDDRHRRPLGADDLRAPRVLRPGREVARLRRLAHDLGEGRGPDLPRGHAPHAREARPRAGGDRRAPARGRAAGRAPAQRAAAAARRPARAARGGPRTPTWWSAATSASTASSTSATSGRAAWSARPCACASGATPRPTCPDGEEERIAWLYERWQVLDDWVGEQRSSGMSKRHALHRPTSPRSTESGASA